MKIGVFILCVVFTVGLIVGAIIMAIKYGLFRNPFKDKWGRWKDDISRKEQIIWNFFLMMGGVGYFLLYQGIFLVPLKTIR